MRISDWSSDVCSSDLTSNGRDVRAKDVALIFADAATGAHSPALVSQGKIANVIAAKPTERRAMLEEAAGIAGLHVRRKDDEQKLRDRKGVGEGKSVAVRVDLSGRRVCKTNKRKLSN